MKKILTLGLGALMLAAVLGLTAEAQTTPSTSSGQASSTSVEELQKQIQLLLGQIQSLQKEVTGLKSATPSIPTVAPATPTTPSPTILQPTPAVIDESEVSGTEAEFISPPTLTRSLFRGSRGDDVRQLQEFLAQDPTIYPEGLATGFYGAGTEAAVRKWQAKNGLPSVGVIGRQTIAKFKEIYSGVLGGLKQQSDRSDTSIFTRPTAPKPSSCPVYGYMPVCQEGQAPYDANSCQVCQIKTDTAKKEICPALPTVDSCLAGEERVVTYKSAQCGVYYACKPRSTPAPENNTYADIKPAVFGQDTNRYYITLYDTDGIQKYSVMQANGAEVYLGYPGCRAEATSAILTLEKSSFPIKVLMADCRSGAKSSVELNAPAQTTTTTGSIFPYKFSNGKIVYSSADARSYCYANGPGTGQGVASECETKFGVVYQTIITTTTSGQSCDSALATLLGIGCHYMYNDSASNPVFCDNSMTKSAKRGDTATTAGCSGSTTTTTTAPAGQKEQVWNSLGLRSWIRTDADQTRIEQLKSACVSVPTGANIWSPNAGTSSSVDFGMPSAEKCRVATSCSSAQYFDGAACVAGTATTWNTTDTCSQYGSGWHSMSAGLCFDSAMQNYRATNGALYSCSATPATGCSGTTTTTTSTGSCDSSLIALLGDGCHPMYADSSGNQIFCDGPMSKSATRGAGTAIPGCLSPTSSTQTTLLYEDSRALCTDGIDNDRDGLIDSADSSCTAFTTTTTTTTSTGCSQYGSGWHTMGSDGNCFDTNMTSYRTANSTLYSCSATPTTGCSSSSSTSCASGQYWNGTACVSSTTSTTCSSGQYWNGSACVASPGYTDPSTACANAGGTWNASSNYCQMPTGSGSSTCTSGQYWNGTACVASTPSASVYDQMKNQLKSMEIILRGLLGR